jgi:hypothetical protein
MNTTSTISQSALTGNYSLFAILRKPVSVLINLGMYIFLLCTAIAGYAVLPDYLKSIKYNCKFKFISQKNAVLNTGKSFYSFDDGTTSWDTSNYSIGDFVCVKN